MKGIIFILLITFSVVSSSQNGNGLEPGDKVPGFQATSADGTTWNFENHVGDKYIVLYFYPAAMTGGCTAQACSYRDLSSDLESEDAMVVGVSGDNVEGLQVFKKAHNLNFTLLSDESGEIASLFGVPTREGGTITREVDGKEIELERGTTANRWTFIIDKKGKVVYKNDDVDASKDTEEVLSFLKDK
ncbi:MAG TPA: peroxiredoxin [Tangfeifania sp.]|nr:peroxiredoxin [Tangfeifania sp.]